MVTQARCRDAARSAVPRRLLGGAGGRLAGVARRRPAPRRPARRRACKAVTDTLNDAFAQRQISTIYGQANQYRVVLEALPMYQRDPSILSKLYLPGAAGSIAGAPGAQVPLSAVATLTRTTAPLAISHQAQFPAISLSFNLAPGAALGDAVEAVKTIETRIGMPSSIVGVYSGDAAEFAKSLAGQPWLILAAARHDLHRARRAL